MGGPSNAGSTGKIDVDVSDQHTRMLDLGFVKSVSSPTTLSVAAAPGDLTVTVADATSFADGNVIAFFITAGQFYFGQQIGAPAANVITLDTPVDVAYPAGSSVINASKEMAVNGAVTTQVFQIGPVGAGGTLKVDITRVLGYLQDNVAMDDAKFGGITALTNGVVLRVNNGVMQNIWNLKSNGEISELCFDFVYTSKAPSGSYGARFRNTFAGQSKHGVVIRLDPGDTLEMLIQDDLTGLESFTMVAQGHVVEDR